MPSNTSEECRGCDGIAELSGLCIVMGVDVGFAVEIVRNKDLGINGVDVRTRSSFMVEAPKKL